MAQNIKYELRGDKLILTIDVSEQQINNTTRTTKRGNKLVATTDGWLGIMPEGSKRKGSIAVNLNMVYK